MNDLVKLFVSLGLVCAIGCAALVAVNDVTEEPRHIVQQKTLDDNLLMVLPAGADCTFDPTKTVSFDDVIFHRAYKDGKLVAVVAETSGKGFGGPVNALVGFDAVNMTIARVVVTEHSETPGLGSQATDRKEQKSLWHSSDLAEGQLPPNNYLDKGYAGKPVTDKKFRIGHPEPDKPELVEAVSGATYSSKGVLYGVNKACQTLTAHKAEILN